MNINLKLKFRKITYTLKLFKSIYVSSIIINNHFQEVNPFLNSDSIVNVPLLLSNKSRASYKFLKKLCPSPCKFVILPGLLSSIKSYMLNIIFLSYSF